LCIEGNEWARHKFKTPPCAVFLIYCLVQTGSETFGKRMFAGWVRKQVDFANVMLQNRHGLRAAGII